jgi:integrase
LGERCENNVLERPYGGSKVFALRFRAYGRRRYLTLGTPEEGWTRRRGEEEMDVIRAEVARGTWVPPAPRHMAAVGDRGRGEDAAPFGSFARSQVEERRSEVRPATSGYWDWALGHLLPFFADWPLTKIDVWAVDAYRLHKLEESDDRRRRLAEGRPRTDALGRPLRPLSAGSINKTIEVLRWLLSFAVEYGWIDDNPAAGRRRRIKVDRSPPPHLESAGQIAAVLDAAAELDADPGWLIDDRLPVVAVLVFSGLRVHELSALRWGDLDFATSTIRVRHSKTPAGIREVRMLPALRDHLLYTAVTAAALVRVSWSSRRAGADLAPRTTCVCESSDRSWPAPRSCSRPAARRRCRPGSRHTRSATPSPPSSSRSARTPSR